MAKVLVAGGGITGLTAAYRLLQADPALEVAVVDPGPWGGKIRTERPSGFVIDGGPDSFISQKPWALELCRELGLESSLEKTLGGRKPTFIVSRGRLVEIPEGLLVMAPTRLGPFLKTPLLSWPGKLRAGLDLLLPGRPAEDDESMASFIERRFGRELFERVAEPLLGGLYAGNAADLSLASTFPQFAALERSHGSVIRGLRSRAAQAGEPSRYTLFMTLREGLGQLVEALVARLPPGVLKPGRVKALRPEGSGLTVALESGESLRADAVISALPAFAAAEALSSAQPALSQSLASIGYASSATVSLAYKGLPEPEGYGFVVPRVEGRRLLACTWSSAKYPGRAPEGHLLLRGYLGGDAWAGLTDEALVRVVREELRDLMALEAEPVLTRVFRWERAMPQYRVGHPALLSRLESQAARVPRLVLAGSAYRGVGVPDCIRSAGQARDSVLALLQGRDAPRVA